MRRLRVSFRLPLLVAVALAAAGLAACSSGSSAPGSSTSSASSASSAPELSTVTVDLRETVDSAPVWIAEQDGFFRQQGLTIDGQYASGTAAEYTGLAAHTVDFALVDYISLLHEEAENPQLGLRVIADDEQGAPDTTAIMLPSGSRITSVAQLKGKTIAFSSPGVAFGELALDEQLKAYGLGPGSYTVDAMGFPDMIEPLARGEIAAAFSLQPYMTEMESQIGAHPLIDLMTGPMTDFPVLGWATTSYFANKYPKTVAAFQRAVEKGQQLAASDTSLDRQTLVKNIKTVSPKIANVIALNTYDTGVSLTRLQRVATTMEQFGDLPKNFNVAQMIIPIPSGA
jgi:NitT/TauT family transport system substrate-binding protein